MQEIMDRIKSYNKKDVKFTKKDYTDKLLNLRNFEEKVLINELLSLKNLKVIEPENIEFKGKLEKRYRVYFVYSNGRGRCYVIKLNKILKIITVFPLGRKTLNKWRRKLKEEKK